MERRYTCWALRSFAEATSFIAEVIFSVLWTEPIRPFISLREGIGLLHSCNDRSGCFLDDGTDLVCHLPGGEGLEDVFLVGG